MDLESAPSDCGDSAGRFVYAQSHLLLLAAVVDSLDISPFPLRPVNETGMENPPPAGIDQYRHHRGADFVGLNISQRY